MWLYPTLFHVYTHTPHTSTRSPSCPPSSHTTHPSRGDQEEESQSLFGDSEEPDIVTVGGEREEEGGRDQQLWVEKYSPRLYTELLSDDVSTTHTDQPHALASITQISSCSQFFSTVTGWGENWDGEYNIL